MLFANETYFIPLLQVSFLILKPFRMAHQIERQNTVSLITPALHRGIRIAIMSLAVNSGAKKPIDSLRLS